MRYKTFASSCFFHSPSFLDSSGHKPGAWHYHSPEGAVDIKNSWALLTLVTASEQPPADRAAGSQTKVLIYGGVWSPANAVVILDPLGYNRPLTHLNGWYEETGNSSAHTGRIFMTKVQGDVYGCEYKYSNDDLLLLQSFQLTNPSSVRCFFRLPLLCFWSRYQSRLPSVS